jgi:hypothetical protein
MVPLNNNNNNNNNDEERRVEAINRNMTENGGANLTPSWFFT